MATTAGSVEAVSKEGTGIKVNGLWYNAKPETKDFVAKVKRGDEVRLDADEARFITFIRIQEQRVQLERSEQRKVTDTPQLDPQATQVIDEYGELMRLCKQKTDEIFGDDQAYQESKGQHCNSLFIAAERRLARA